MVPIQAVVVVVVVILVVVLAAVVPVVCLHGLQVTLLAFKDLQSQGSLGGACRG